WPAASSDRGRHGGGLRSSLRTSSGPSGIAGGIIADRTFASLLRRAILRPPQWERKEIMATVGHNRKKLGAECMADMLEAYGVTHVFHVPAVLRKTFAVMETRTRIKRLHVHSEATAAYMADGYARASGKPGICMAQVIGALNLAAGLRDAWL